ncbi:GyrI-like domain-containing protein [Zhihengliuella halotolerans]|uniref:GyrI-like domain-containing protein n=1 Tax=Zhihengliuella halotolerans TaxID=370736 RepID=UPI000C80589A|nr:GyrI-like domain-containing protein [Zhihengliuella halotolerans]
MTGKIDFKKSLDAYRATRGRFRLIEIPEMRYLAVDGRGDPNTSPAYADAIATLYPVAYTLKFASKRELGRDYVVPPLEGLWWAEDMDAFTTARDKSRWEWTLMIMVPDWIEPDLYDDAVARVRAKGPPTRLGDVRLEALSEGLCVQTLHVGPYDDEAAVLEAMHREFVPENGLRLSGRHHEIYLSDARRVAPERLRTILRQPVVSA